MADNNIVMTSAIEKMDDTVSHHEGATRTGESTPTTEICQAEKKTAQQAPLSQHVVEGQRENLLYTEDPGFLPIRKDPRYTFYRHPKKEKFDIKNEDVLRAIEEANLLEHLELLQVSRSNKSIEARFQSEKAAQQFVECEITFSGNSFVFWSNAQRRLRVSIHGVHPSISDAALECELMPYFGGVLDIKRDTRQYKNKVYETGTRTFIGTELYRHIPRSCQIFNKWCLVYYTGQPYTARKTPAEIPKDHPDKDEEELMSTSEAGTNSQKDNPDEESSASFVTVEEKETSFSSKRNIDQEAEEPRLKKQKPDKDNCFEMELMIKQLTTVVRELEEHEFRHIADVLGEDRSTEIDGVIGNMICLVETALDISGIPSEQLIFYEKRIKKREKQISSEAMHDSFFHMGFYKKHFLRMKRLRNERALQPPP